MFEPIFASPSKDGTYAAFALGYMSLDDEQLKCKPNMVRDYFITY